MEIKMSTPKVEQKPKAVLFHISHSLFKNKRLKRRLAGESRKKSPKKKLKTKRKPEINGRLQQSVPPASETIEISTDEEDEPSKPSEVETSIVLSSDEEDESAAQTRIFPMLTNETTVRTAVGNTVYELSLTQLKENLETITKKPRKGTPASKRRRSPASVNVSISLLSDDEDNNTNSTPSTAEVQARASL